jgi:hypothetical protein
MRGLEHDALDDRRYNVAGVVVIGPAAEGDIGPDRARKIFFGDLRHTPRGMLAQRFSGIDLMARDPYVH